MPLPALSSRPILLVTFLGLALFLILSIVIQNLGWPNPVFNSIRFIPHYDKIGHFFLMGGLNFFLLLLLVPRWPSKKNRIILLTTIVVSLVVGLEELSQAFIPQRTFSLLDFGASLLGITLASYLATSQRLIRSAH